MVTPALFAYIDPVSGTILLQVIIAGIVGCATLLRRTIWRILSFPFRKRRADEDTAN